MATRIGHSAPSPDVPALRVVDTAFPEAAERVTARFFVRGGPGEAREPMLRWVTGLERPIAYALDEESGTAWLSSSALRGIGLTRAGIHERALEHVRRTLPAGFGPTDEPAILDDGASALLVLPELVPEGESWLAVPLDDGSLVVLNDGAPGAEDELRRLADDLSGEPLFARPVRVRRRGFEPAQWPRGAGGRTTDPGFSTLERDDAAREKDDDGGAR